VPAMTVALKRFESIAWEDREVAQFRGGIELMQFSLRHPRDALEPSARLAPKQRGRLLRAERSDHLA